METKGTDMNLDGKQYIVTGGSRGLGRAIVKALAQAGATVMSAQRSADDGLDHANVHNYLSLIHI